jgi:ATP-dependent RNA helicase DHX36
MPWDGASNLDGTTASEFADLMASQEGRLQAGNALTWFSLVHDAGSLPVRDVTYYSTPNNYPLETEYPQLPPGLFKKPPPIDAVAWLHQLLETEAESSVMDELVKRKNSYIWRHTMTVSLKGYEIEAVGEDESKTEARTATCMHLLQQLHETRLLQEIALSNMTTPNKIVAIKQTQVPSAAVKLQVYNYAARFGLTPTIKFKHLPADKVETTVSLYELGIRVTATGQSESNSELLACALFKEAAESRQANLSSDRLVLRDSKAVNLDNASNILLFYSFVHGGDPFRYTSNPEDPLDPESRVSASVSRYGKVVGSSVTMPDRATAQALARLVAATSLVKTVPDLLLRFHDAVEGNNGVVPTRTPPTPVELGAVEPLLNEWSAAVDKISIPEHVPKPAILSQYRGERLRDIMKIARGRRYANTYHMTKQSLTDRSEFLRSRQEANLEDLRFQERKKERSRLPINEYRDELLALVKNNAQCIVVGTAGSGKSTQLPQIILDDAIADGKGADCNIYHTQPRRSTAVSLAHRVASERSEALCEVVGYWIGGDRQQADLGGSINFCTSEVLQVQLQNTFDEFLDHASHIIIDEIHERDNPTNRLLMLLKLAFATRLERGASVPKLILMSATLQSGLFERYFELTDETGMSLSPPVITIPGRQFPISYKYLGDVVRELGDDFSSAELQPVLQHPTTQSYIKLELDPKEEIAEDIESPRVNGPIDWESQFEHNMKTREQRQALGLVATTIAHVARSTDNGDILVFLTSWKEIAEVENLLYQGTFMGLDFTDGDKFAILWIHSIYPESISQAMEPGRQGRRRILLATNVAETSHTFPEVKYVIDSGKRRASEYGANALSTTLYRKWISKASVTQRAGRIGRVQPGEYYALFTETQKDSLSPFQEAQAEPAEKIQQLCLQARFHFPSLSIHQFFARMIDPPPRRNLDAAIRQLQATGALVEGEELTDLGITLAKLRRWPNLGKMLLLAVLFRCLEPMLAIAAMADRKEHPYHYVAQNELMQAAVDKLRRDHDRGSMSDIIAQLNTLGEFRNVRDRQGIEVAREWAAANHLRFDFLQGVDKRAYENKQLLRQINCIGDDDRKDGGSLNRQSKNQGLIKALIMVGLNPNIAAHARNDLFYTNQSPYPSSLWHDSLVRPVSWQPGSRRENPLRHTLCTFRESRSLSVNSKDTVLSNATPVSPLAVALFAQSLHMKHDGDTVLVVDGWLPLKINGSSTAAQTLLNFKRQLDSTLNVALQRLCNPTLRRQTHFDALEVMIQTVSDLLEYEEKKWRQRMDKLDRSL